MLQTARCLCDNLLRYRKHHVIWALTCGGVRISRLQSKNGVQKSLTLLQTKGNIRLENEKQPKLLMLLLIPYSIVRMPRPRILRRGSVTAIIHTRLIHDI